jgi:rSAM/selenodomain-associated transferase 2
VAVVPFHRPPVSVVVPTLDESGRIVAVLDHLAGLGVSEIVVSDGGSRDGTVALAASRGVRVVQGPKGRARQMNLGAAAARGTVLWFVHADGEPAPGSVEAIEAALGVDGVVGGAFHTRTVDDRVPGPPPAWMRLADVRQRVTRHPYGDQALFVRADVFRKVGGFREDLRMFEDVDLCRRLWGEGALRVVHPEIRVSARRYYARPVRSVVAMNLFPTAWRLGVPTSVLERLYGAPR